MCWSQIQYAGSIVVSSHNYSCMGSELILDRIGVNHYLGKGQLQRKDCPVRFIFWTPIEETTDFILVYSVGQHTHAPPPPTRAPKKILEGLACVLRRMNQRHLTLSMGSLQDQL